MPILRVEWHPYTSHTLKRGVEAVWARVHGGVFDLTADPDGSNFRTARRHFFARFLGQGRGSILQLDKAVAPPHFTSPRNAGRKDRKPDGLRKFRYIFSKV